MIAHVLISHDCLCSKMFAYRYRKHSNESNRHPVHSYGKNNSYEPVAEYPQRRQSAM